MRYKLAFSKHSAKAGKRELQKHLSSSWQNPSVNQGPAKVYVKLAAIMPVHVRCHCLVDTRAHFYVLQGGS